MHVHINYNINHQFVYQLLHLPIAANWIGDETLFRYLV